jgi:hypothetical protein
LFPAADVFFTPSTHASSDVTELPPRALIDTGLSTVAPFDGVHTFTLPAVEGCEHDDEVETVKVRVSLAVRVPLTFANVTKRCEPLLSEIVVSSVFVDVCRAFAPSTHASIAVTAVPPSA